MDTSEGHPAQLTADRWLAITLAMLAERKGLSYTREQLTDAIVEAKDTYGSVDAACDAVWGKLTDAE